MNKLHSKKNLNFFFSFFQFSPNEKNQENSGEGENTAFKSRGYQDEILKSCIEQNTIIYLPTGAGKTYIAIMALKHFAKDLEK